MMKKIILLVAIPMAVVLSAGAKNAAKEASDTTIVYTVSPQMHCENCEKKIKSNIRFERGVKSIETNIEKQTVTIKADKKKINVESLKKSFKKIGYTVK